MNVVYVLSPDRVPLMPCSCTIARLLLKQGKAKVVRRTPFTIKMYTQPVDTHTQLLTLGIDTGSAVIGSAVSDECGNILYVSEVEVRNDIAQTMKKRATSRRNRRYRKTRYRPARWLNRRNSLKTGRFSPTMTSKTEAHLREIRFVQSLLPIQSIVLETGTFNPHALKHPAVLQNKWMYQKGINYGFANTKAYVLTRDGYVCQRCKGQSKDRRLEVHHIVFRSQQGSDEEANLLTLCKTCHEGLHAGTVTLKQKGKRKGNLLHATQMNSIRIQLLSRVEAIETWGFVTKEQGKHSQQRIPTGKIAGFRKFDKVRYLGVEYFIKGRMSTGYAILMDLSGNKLALKPTPKFDNMKRVSARSSWIINQKAMPSFSSSTT